MPKRFSLGSGGGDQRVTVEFVQKQTFQVVDCTSKPQGNAKPKKEIDCSLIPMVVFMG